MKRSVTVAGIIWCSFGCGAAEDRAHDESTDGVAGANSHAEDGWTEDGWTDALAGANSQAENTSNESSQTSVARRICDGSDGIRFALGYGGGGQPFPYTSVLSELGYDFLYVDGHCHYWVHQPLSVVDEYYLWRPYRERVLTPADEERLHELASYDGASTDPCAPRPDVSDAGAAFLWDGREFRSCADDVYEASGPLRAELFGAAAAVTGPMRIQVGKDSYPEAPVVYDWPLPTPIDQFAIEYGETRSFRIDGVTGATALRALRDRAIAATEASSHDFVGVIAVRSSDGNQSYFMSLRDELPFSGADGLWVPAP